MRRLEEPDFDDSKIFDDIAAAKHSPTGAQLESCRAQVMQAYADYQALAPDVGALVAPAMSDAAKAALHHCFDSPTRPMNDLRDWLSAPVAAVRCPFCGISEATTLDHYLPKELHPLYTIYSKNLVPCCPKCNSHKSTKIMIENVEIRRFLHPYFDPIPVESFLQVSVELSPRFFVVDYGLVQPAGMGHATFAQLESHFRELNLRSRYRSNALHRLTESRHAFRRHFAKDHSGAVLAAELQGESQDLEIEHGPNDWLSLLYRELAEIDEFVTGGFEVLFSIQ